MLHKEYTITREECTELSWEYLLDRFRLLRMAIRCRVWIAAVAGLAYAFLSPGEFTVNGEPSMVGGIIVTVLFQASLCALIVYLLLHWLLFAPRRAVKRQFQKKISASPEMRVFEIAAGRVAMSGGPADVAVSPERVSAVVETAGATWLYVAGDPLFVLPKRVCSTDEIRQALGSCLNFKA